MMQTLYERIEAFIDWTGRSIAWLTLFMVLVTTVVVILRYVFDTGWIAMQESINYMHASVFMIAAAYTLKQDAHVRVDIFYNHLSAKGKAWVDFLGTLLMLIPTLVFIIWISWDYVAESWSIHESSREAGGLPGVYVIKSLIPLMATLLILQAIALLLRSLQTLLQQEPH